MHRGNVGYTDEFKLPHIDQDEFKIGDRVRVALPFGPNSNIYVDDLRIYENTNWGTRQE